MDQNWPFWPKYAHFWTKIGPKIDKKWILKIRTIYPAEIILILSEYAASLENRPFLAVYGPGIACKFDFGHFGQSGPTVQGGYML